YLALAPYYCAIHMTHSASSPPGGGGKPGATNFLFFWSIFDEFFEGANGRRCGAGTESESEAICWLVICATLVSYHIYISKPHSVCLLHIYISKPHSVCLLHTTRL